MVVGSSPTSAATYTVLNVDSNSDGVKTAEIAEDEEIILPWEMNLAPATKEDYKRDARWFLEHGGFVNPKRIHHRPGPDFAAEITSSEVEAGIRRMVEALRRDNAMARRLVLSFIRKQNERIEAGRVATSEVKNLLKPIRLAMEMNEILVPWKKYSRLVQRGRTKKRDREYRLEEIRLMLPRASLHLQVPLLFMASSGVRVGAFDYLNVGHVRPVFRFEGEIEVPHVGEYPLLEGRTLALPEGAELVCGAMLVYSDESGDEYDTMVSKEAYAKWREYIELRMRAGEKVAGESPAIVTRAGSGRWKSKSIANAVCQLLWNVGLRTEKKKRHEVQMDHGFRKFYDNAMNDHVDKVYVEILMGHGAKVGTVDLGVSKHYDRHLPRPAVEQYLRAMPFLSVDEAYRNELIQARRADEAERAKGQDLRELKLELLSFRDENRELKEQQKRTQETIEALMKHPGLSAFLKEHSVDS